MFKDCFKCGKHLELSEFYAHPMMADGHLNKCKECTKRDVSTDRAAKREQYSEYERLRNQSEKRKEKRREGRRKHDRRNPQKARARRMLTNAVKDGKIERKPCTFCGETKSQAHHEDYSKPLDVIWACFKCHREKLHGQIVVSDFLL